MISVVLRWDIAPGKREDAIDWAHRNAELRRKQPGVEDVRVMIPLHGPYSRILIVTRLASLTAWDEFKKNIDLTALRNEVREKGYFVPGSLERALLEER